LNTEERRVFVHSHRAAIFGYSRKNDGPSLTVVYYVMGGEDILIVDGDALEDTGGCPQFKGIAVRGWMRVGHSDT
jgi:hypothetical protein